MMARTRIEIVVHLKLSWAMRMAVAIMRAPMFVVGGAVVSVIWGLALLAHSLSQCPNR